MKFGYIYLITNTINNKIYIGKTVTTPKTRFKSHLSSSFRENATGYNCYLHNSIRKYGKENFKVEEICYCNETELSKAEMYFIRIFREKGYILMNLTDGGDGMTGYKIPKEKIKSGSQHYGSRVIYQYSLTGEFIKEHGSIIEASKEFNVHHSAIQRCCGNKVLTSAGFIWKYEKMNVSKFVNLNKNKRKCIDGENRKGSKAVIKLDMNENVIKRYPYLRAVLKDGYDNGTISKVCNGKQKTAYGYLWKFE